MTIVEVLQRLKAQAGATALAAIAILGLAAAAARAEHGRFDRTTPDAREEAYIFTPPGFAAAGKPAVADGEKAGQLRVTIVDRATGKTTPCRVNVVGSDGNFYRPRENRLSAYSLLHQWPDGLAGNRPGKAPIRYFGHFFYTPGEFAVDVPAGPVRIEVWKGLEYRVEMHSTHVTAGAERDVQIELTRTVAMAEQGWHSADPHLHVNRTSDADDNTIFDLLEAEDIRRGMILCYNEDTSNYKGLMPEQATPQLRGLGLESIRERGPYAIVSGQEYRNGVLGHLNLFLRDRLYLTGQQLDPNVGPLYAAVGEETRRQGGYAFHAHGGYGLEIWADLVQGATTGVELLQFGIYRGIGLEGWYHVLNAGFRFPGIAASDYPACRKLGDCRTYAHVEGEASFPAWLRAAAEGRSFMTTGPLVLLDVEDHRPGDIVTTPDKQPKKVRARLRVRSETAPVTNVQLIVNGRIVRELVVPRDAGTAQWLSLDERVELTESSWIAARAFSTSPFGTADAEAHTNPVFFYFAGQPPCAAADIDWLIARLDEQIADHEARQVPEKRQVIDYFRRSRELLVSRKERLDENRAAQLPDKGVVQTALGEPLLSPGTPLHEIRAYIEPRIPAPPRPSDGQEWEAEARRLRQEVLDRVVFRGKARDWRVAPARVEWLDAIPGGSGYHIRKLRYEALPGMWIPALLYEPDQLSGKVPLVLHLNGHERVGKAVEYKQLLSINLAKRGMLVLDLEWLGMGQLATPGFSHYRMNQLDVCGASGLAPFYLAMSRALDLGLAHQHADAARVAAMGLSGGGWQTILISSLDPRVVLANPVAGYGGFRSNILCDDMGDSEQAPTDMAAVADYTHLTALRAGRPTLLTYNASDDCCFKSAHTLEPLLAAARPVFAIVDASDKLRSHVNHVPGTHNFEQENRERFYAMLGEYFHPGDASFVRAELPSRDDLKTADDLHVPLPEDNADFHRLAVGLLAALPPRDALPRDRAAAVAWQRARRDQLRALLKVPDYKASVVSETTGALAGVTVVSRQWRCGDAWTIPGVEFVPAAKPQRTTIVLADAGRASTAAEVERLLRRGDRLLAIDPLGLGESTVQAQDPSYLYPLFLAAVGERPLGIQAAQLIALARLARAAHPQESVTIVASGPRAAMAALVAAALGAEEIQGVEVKDSLSTLAELIERDQTVEKLPELFAFGLAAEFDVAQIAALMAPRRVTIHQPEERARRELSALRGWYELWGETFDPLAGAP
ncbi:MAG TPA: CehA/McbA family metallohydrolase [Pirellulales bacterium]|nr:CehA/McbA family metallohydrolase [Pirellulales bacterium]